MTEADGFAFVTLIGAARNNEDLLNMLWGVNRALEIFRHDSLTIEAVTDEHDLAQRRYATFACLAAGGERDYSEGTSKQWAVNAGQSPALPKGSG